MSGKVSKINEYAILTHGTGNGSGEIETKQNAYAVIRPGVGHDNFATDTKQNAYAILRPGFATDGFTIVSKIVVYVVFGAVEPEVWTGNFGTAGYANPAPSGFGSWNPPST